MFRDSVNSDQILEIRTNVVFGFPLRNAVGHKNRSVNEVQHRWKDLKYDARKTLSQRKNPQTGGKKTKECPFTDLVLNIIGANAP